MIIRNLYSSTSLKRFSNVSSSIGRSRDTAKFVEKFYGNKTLREDNKMLVNCQCFDSI